MRVLLPIAALAVLFAGADAAAQTFSLGPRVGLTAAHQVDSSDGWPRDNVSGRRLGFVGGIQATLELPVAVYVQIEALYSQKGMARPDGSQLRLSYLEMPVLVGYGRAVPGVPFRPFVHGGVAPAREVSCSGRVRANEGEDGQPPPPPLVPAECNRERTFKGDLGVVVGAGGWFDVGAWKAAAEVRYTRGITDLVPAFPSRERHNRQLSLELGFSRVLSLPGL